MTTKTPHFFRSTTAEPAAPEPTQSDSGGRQEWSPRAVIGWAAASGVVLTVAAALIPAERHATPSPNGHIAIETTATIIGALVAYLLVGRALRTGERTDLLLAASLSVLAVSNLALSLIPAIAETDPSGFTTWAPFGGRLIAAVGIAAAALLPPRRLARPRRALSVTALIGIAALALIALTALIAQDTLPQIRPTARGATLDAPTGFAALEIVVTLLYLAAAIGLLRRTEREPEPFLSWLGAAIAFQAFANLNYFLFPSLYSDYIYAGDLFRLASYIALLAGAFREIDTYQRRMAESAVFDERRRLASDLHNGLAQEIAMVTAHSRRLARRSEEGPEITRLVSAAERALDESRAAMQALTRPADEPLERTLESAGRATAEREGVTTEWDLAAGASVTPQVRELLIRIVREAIRNAARHGHANVVRILLTAKAGVRLVISDDGAGFDTSVPRAPDALGLVMIDERIQNHRGTLVVSSAPGAGTMLEVELP